MEQLTESLDNQCCVRCLATPKGCNLQQYTLKCDTLKSVFQADWLILCYICKRMLQQSESFIQNVQSNQLLLENYDGDYSSLQMIQTQIQPITLTTTPTHTLTLTGDNSVEDESFTVIHSGNSYQEIKIEFKEENEVNMDGDLSYDDDDFQDSHIKEEEYPLKREDSDDDIDDVTLLDLKQGLKKPKNLRKVKSRATSAKDQKTMNHVNVPSKILSIELTKKQWLEERQKMEKSERYNNCLYKCTDCMKSFVIKSSYEAHMKKHSVSNGDYVCDFCNQICDTKERLRNHIKGHIMRFKCPECDFMRRTKINVVEHYIRNHGEGNEVFVCPDCKKVFPGKIGLQKHIYNAHKRDRTRLNCEFCAKTYATKHSLISHQIRRHPKESSTGDVSRRWVCQECGAAFIQRSQLGVHARAHDDTREYYCVECNKYFKTANSLKVHLKYTGAHNNYTELPLKCEHCEKRFMLKRDVEKHMNRIHLNRKPYACDKCDKAYISKWSLTAHQKYVHDGYKRPLVYPCSMCDKIFDRSNILKNHIRTHTGERPFQCSKCPAQFSQSSVLGTHIKLVHLKLTRDGRPKTTSK